MTLHFCLFPVSQTGPVIRCAFSDIVFDGCSPSVFLGSDGIICSVVVGRLPVSTASWLLCGVLCWFPSGALRGFLRGHLCGTFCWALGWGFGIDTDINTLAGIATGSIVLGRSIREFFVATFVGGAIQQPTWILSIGAGLAVLGHVPLAIFITGRRCGRRLIGVTRIDFFVAKLLSLIAAAIIWIVTVFLTTITNPILSLVFAGTNGIESSFVRKRLALKSIAIPAVVVPSIIFAINPLFPSTKILFLLVIGTTISPVSLTILGETAKGINVRVVVLVKEVLIDKLHLIDLSLALFHCKT
mmetsp:Transcript_33455/g.60266  ORF Transcript_33455/g.60266 Transcript_33455/m.60266 type:complete len:300 (-) Transcript_33455:518-1417(-)